MIQQIIGNSDQSDQAIQNLDRAKKKRLQRQIEMSN